MLTVKPGLSGQDRRGRADALSVPWAPSGHTPWPGPPPAPSYGCHAHQAPGDHRQCPQSSLEENTQPPRPPRLSQTTATPSDFTLTGMGTLERAWPLSLAPWLLRAALSPSACVCSGAPCQEGRACGEGPPGGTRAQSPAPPLHTQGPVWGQVWLLFVARLQLPSLRNFLSAFVSSDKTQVFAEFRPGLPWGSENLLTSPWDAGGRAGGCGLGRAVSAGAPRWLWKWGARLSAGAPLGPQPSALRPTAEAVPTSPQPRRGAQVSERPTDHRTLGRSEGQPRLGCTPGSLPSKEAEEPGPPSAESEPHQDWHRGHLALPAGCSRGPGAEEARGAQGSLGGPGGQPPKQLACPGAGCGHTWKRERGCWEGKHEEGPLNKKASARAKGRKASGPGPGRCLWRAELSRGSGPRLPRQDRPRTRRGRRGEWQPELQREWPAVGGGRAGVKSIASSSLGKQKTHLKGLLIRIHTLLGGVRAAPVNALQPGRTRPRGELKQRPPNKQTNSPRLFPRRAQRESKLASRLKNKRASHVLLEQ